MGAVERRSPLAVVAGVVARDGRIMLCRRRPEVHNGLKWEFPGGKLEPGEAPEDALRRELREELAIDVRVGRVLDAVLHRYPDRDVLVLFYPCEIVAGEPAPVDCDAVAWAEKGELNTFDLAGADALFVERQNGELKIEN
ncbi:MAG: (deoxy)nucleoside triphosphate pyrophosphohydrolase [Clostridia bacterium]|nr:(deoxy)nucleoside triphosphate pyrophosphohydrolase [Clostridia bacterium]